MAQQQSLLELKHPFRTRFGLEFFKRIPQKPGVYWILDSRRQLIYVGKSKNLKLRLSSYRYVDPARCSKKLRHLITQAHDIHWQTSHSEREAVLLESRLLHSHQPPLNTVSSRQETLLYIGLEICGNDYSSDHSGLSFYWGPQNKIPEAAEAFGAFKSRVRTQLAFASLMRCLWLVTRKRSPQSFVFSPPLSRPVLPTQFDLDFAHRSPINWYQLSRQYLSGESCQLLDFFRSELSEWISPQQASFISKVVKDDIESLQRFFELGPLKNHSRSETYSASTLNSTSLGHPTNDAR